MELIDRWMKAGNIAFYYGTGLLSKLMQFDVVVVEPKGHSEEDISALKSKGIITIAYISIMEITKDFAEFSALKDEDFIHNDGKPLRNTDYGTYILDLQSQKWRNILMHKAGKLLTGMGYDGLFLDTIGDVELSSLGQRNIDVQVRAALEIVKKMRNLFPNHLLIQNNGLELLIDSTYPVIDGICWENPPLKKSESYLWCEAVLNKLDAIRKKHKFRVILLDEKDSIDQTDIGILKFSLNTARNLSVEKGFLYYQGPKHYLGDIYTHLL